jgi:hypothetical protein
VESEALRNARNHLHLLATALLEYRNARQSGESSKIEKAEEKLDQLDPGVNASDIRREELEKNLIQQIESLGIEILTEIYRRGIISRLKSDINSNTLSLRISPSREELISREEVFDIEEASKYVKENGLY